MQNKDTTPATAQTSTQHTARERVGLAIYGTDSAETLSAIAAAEAAGLALALATAAPEAAAEPAVLGFALAAALAAAAGLLAGTDATRL